MAEALEAFFRAVNERVAELSPLGHTRLELLCECGHPGCSQTFAVPPEVFAAVRAAPGLWLCVHAHVDGRDVVERTDSYVIVRG